MNEISISGRRSERTVFNLLCGIAEHAVSACIALIITPFLIKRLGIELYGLYPIVLEISAFFGIAFGIVNSTSSRYIAIEEEQGNADNASKYFSSRSVSGSLKRSTASFKQVYISFSSRSSMDSYKVARFRYDIAAFGRPFSVFFMMNMALK